MSINVITISREFGSGGRSVGKALATKLGIPYYDKDLVKEIALKSGLAPTFVEEKSDYAGGKTGISYALNIGTPGVMNGLSVEEYLWTVQCQVVRDLASRGPCIIVGRCANYILREREDCLHVFIHADKAYRAERVTTLYGESNKKIEKRLDEKDGKRRANYKHFTNGQWGKAQNYHVTLDSSKLGIDQCVAVLADMYQHINRA